MKEEIKYKIDEFEGPLDLLLTLIDKNKMNIADIPIAEICDQYMAYISEAQRLDLDLASDFIVMASHLMLMKSKMLLPQDKEEVKQMKEELQDTLALYKQAKIAAEELKPLWVEFSGRMIKEEDEIPPEKGAILGLDPQLLSRAMNTMINRFKLNEESPTMITPLIKNKVYSVEERIEKTLKTLRERGESSLFYLIRNSESRAEMIAYFMGILELVKLRRILIHAQCPEGEHDELGVRITFVINEDYVPDDNDNNESEFENDEPETQDSEGNEDGKSDEINQNNKNSLSDDGDQFSKDKVINNAGVNDIDTDIKVYDTGKNNGTEESYQTDKDTYGDYTDNDERRNEYHLADRDNNYGQAEANKNESEIEEYDGYVPDIDD